MNDADEHDGEREVKDKDRLKSTSFAEGLAGVDGKVSSSRRLGTFRAIYSPAGDDRAADVVRDRRWPGDLWEARRQRFACG